LLAAAEPILAKIKENRAASVQMLMGDLSPELKAAVVTALKNIKNKLVAGCMSRCKEKNE
jgi:hypothetical protein